MRCSISGQRRPTDTVSWHWTESRPLSLLKAICCRRRRRQSNCSSSDKCLGQCSTKQRAYSRRPDRQAVNRKRTCRWCHTSSDWTKHRPPSRPPRLWGDANEHKNRQTHGRTDGQKRIISCRPSDRTPTCALNVGISDVWPRFAKSW